MGDIISWFVYLNPTFWWISCVHECLMKLGLIDCLKHSSLEMIPNSYLFHIYRILLLFLRFEILGMHRNVQHRVDYMDWAPGLANCFLSDILAIIVLNV